MGSVLLRDEAGAMADLTRACLAANALHAPPHLPTELASLIAVAFRRKRVDERERTLACEEADAILAAATLHPAAAAATLVPFALEHGLTVYDAAYVALARALGVPLLTADTKMRHVAELLSVGTITP